MLKVKQSWFCALALLMAVVMTLGIFPSPIVVSAQDTETGSGTGRVCASSFKSTTSGDLNVTKTVDVAREVDNDKAWGFEINLTKPDSENTSYPYSIDNGGTSGKVEFNGSSATLPFQLKNGQTLSIMDLPAETTYTVTETEKDLDGYNTTYEYTNEAIKGENKQTNTVIFTNTYHPNGSGGLTVMKRVVGSNNPDTERKWNFTVTLTGSSNDGNYVQGTDISGEYGDMTFNGGKAQFQLTDSESKTATGLPPGIQYKVVEDEANNDGYHTSWVDKSDEEIVFDENSVIPANDTATVKAINSTSPGNLTVSKKVVGEGGDTNKSWNFTVSLTGTSTDKQVKGEEFSTPNEIVDGPKFTEGTASFTLKSGESETLYGIPSGLTYTVTEEEDNRYVTTWSPSNTGTIKAYGGVTVQAINSVKGSLKITKIVSNGGSAAANKDYHFTVTGPNGYINDNVTIKGSGDITLNDLAPGTYTVAEDRNDAQISGWTVEVTGEGNAIVEAGKTADVKITNEYSEKQGSLKIRKTVKGGGDGAENKEYTFTVTGPNGYNESVAIPGNGEETLGNLTPGEYTVTEDKDGAKIKDCTLEVTGERTVTVQAEEIADIPITNTYLSTTAGNLTVTKKVTGKGDKDREFNFVVKVDPKVDDDTYGDMTFTDGEARFTLKNGESKTATGIPAGRKYTVTEEEANEDGYVTTVEGGEGTIIPESTGSVTAEFTNELPEDEPQNKTGNLTVTKTITGEGDKNRDFHFVVTVNPKLNGTYGGMTFTNGEANFVLKPPCPHA